MLSSQVLIVSSFIIPENFLHPGEIWFSFKYFISEKLYRRSIGAAIIYKYTVQIPVYGNTVCMATDTSGILVVLISIFLLQRFNFVAS
jgi:hypothetical protein